MYKRALDNFKMFTSVSTKMYNFMIWIRNEVLKIILFVVSMYRNKTIIFFLVLL